MYRERERDEQKIRRVDGGLEQNREPRWKGNKTVKVAKGWLPLDGIMARSSARSLFLMPFLSLRLPQAQTHSKRSVCVCVYSSVLQATKKCWVVICRAGCQTAVLYSVHIGGYNRGIGQGFSLIYYLSTSAKQQYKEDDADALHTLISLNIGFRIWGLHIPNDHVDLYFLLFLLLHFSLFLFTDIVPGIWRPIIFLLNYTAANRISLFFSFLSSCPLF